MIEQHHPGDNGKPLEEAAEWYFRRDAAPLSPEDEAAFREWLAVPLNRQAYARLDSTWQKLAQVPHAAQARMQPKSFNRRLGMAASIAAVAILGIGYATDLPVKLQADALTRRGEMHSVKLDDGSEIILNSGSAVAFDYSKQERRIRLLRGEAIFKVAKEQPVRPFIVSAGAGEARALGTAFAVREEGGGAVVTVLESRVAVTYPTGALNRVELGSDQAVAFSGRGMESIQTVDAQDATAWQRGKLVFVDRPLGSVIEELNRYHSGRILITDAAIGDHHVSGVFDTKDPVSVVNALEASLGLKSTRLTSYLILLHL